jgi:hypothetical protein
MSAKQMLAELEARCARLGVKLFYDDLRSDGGPCRANACYYVVINRRASVETRVRILAQALPLIEERLDEERRARAAAPSAAAASEPVETVERAAEVRAE